MMNMTFSPVQFAARKKPAAPAPQATAANLGGAEWRNSYRMVAAGTQVLTTKAEWNNFWKNQMQDEAPKGFDPKKQMAVVIALGARSSGGYGVEIKSAGEVNGQFVVKYAEKRPQGMATMAITYPALVKLFPKTELPVVIQKD